VTLYNTILSVFYFLYRKKYDFVLEALLIPQTLGFQSVVQCHLCKRLPPVGGNFQA